MNSTPWLVVLTAAVLTSACDTQTAAAGNDAISSGDATEAITDDEGVPSFGAVTPSATRKTGETCLQAVGGTGKNDCVAGNVCRVSAYAFAFVPTSPGQAYPVTPKKMTCQIQPAGTSKTRKLGEWCLGNTIGTGKNDCVAGLQCRPSKVAFVSRPTTAGYPYEFATNEMSCQQVGSGSATRQQGESCQVNTIGTAKNDCAPGLACRPSKVSFNAGPLYGGQQYVQTIVETTCQSQLW